MTAETFSGPCIIGGDMYGIPGLVPEYNPDAGPSVDFQGNALIDVRYFPLNKDNIKPGTVPCEFNYPYLLSVDAVPSTLSATNIAAAQLPTSGTPLTLAAKSTGIATGIPFLPFKGSSVVTANIALDFGMQSANVTSGSKNVTVTDTTKFTVGMPVVIANVGNSGATTALLTWVTSITNSTVLVVNDAPLATNSATPIGTGNWWGNMYGNPGASTFAAQYLAAGAALVRDPTQGLCRGVRIVGTSLTAGGAVTISGYDFYNQPQTETLTLASGSTTQWSQKTYRYIQSVTPAFTDGSHNISVGTSDLFGFAIRNDKWEYDNIYWAGAFLTASTGWVAADTTTPATATTKDVRGTIQIGTNGPSGSGATGGASNGSLRLAIFHSQPLWNVIGSSANLGSVSMYGVTPV